MVKPGVQPSYLVFRDYEKENVLDIIQKTCQDKRKKSLKQSLDNFINSN